jgi:hypothetical protein
MIRLIRNLAAAVTNRSPRPQPSRPRTSRLRLEQMEERTCPTTVQAFANALNNQITMDVNRFVRDAAIVETYQPTLISGTISQDLVRINTDARNNDTLRVFADFQTLGQHLFLEAKAVVANRLPNRYALLANTQIVSDLTSVANDKQVTFAFIGYIATHTQYHATAPTSSVFSSALFGPGTIGGTTQAILAQQYQNALTHYSGPTLSSYNHYFDSLSGNIAASAKFDALAQNVNPGGV